MMELIVLSALVLAGVGLVLGALIGLIAKKFGVDSDPKAEQVKDCLPGANCGGCGYAGCGDLADAVVKHGETPTKCHAMNTEQLKKISAILGVELVPSERMVAVVMCGGGISKSQRNATYNGVMDCWSATLQGSGAGKACRYGCLGYGSCAHTCAFGAIEICDGLAVVHPELCHGCGACVAACPRKLIHLIPARAKTHILCSSPESGKEKRNVCSVPCIACQKCLRVCPDGFTMKLKSIHVNYDNPPCGDLASKVKCPTGALHSEGLENIRTDNSCNAPNCGKETMK